MPAPTSTFDLTWASERHLRLSFAPGVGAHGRVRAAYDALGAAGVRGVADLTPAFETLLVHLEPAALTPGRAEQVEQSVRRVLAGVEGAPLPAGRAVDLPVCYDASCGPDLAELAAGLGLSERAVVELHAGATYTVCFLGFSPGFPYLSGLPKALAVPRLASPRSRVPAGSIAIAGEQAGIYPRETAGGWRLLGRTPVDIFDASAASPALLRIGDRVRFSPISLAEYGARASTGGPR